MFVSHKHKFIFLHTGKCGCKSISSALDIIIDEQINVNPPNDHPSLEFLSNFIIDSGLDLNQYKLLTLSRNPYDRMVSWYYYAINTTKSFSGNFDYFCEERLQSFSENLLPPYEKSDYIIRFENMQDDFNFFLNSLNLGPHKLPHIQHGTNRPNQKYAHLYSDQSRKIVETYFSNVIELFGYIFEN